MSIYKKEKYGFVYLWRDRKYNRYYIGSHWGIEDDGYICSSRLMRQSYRRRPDDFKRRIIARVYTNRKDLLKEEYRWLAMIDKTKTFTYNKTPESRDNVRYYNIHLNEQDMWWADENKLLTTGEKISKANKGKNTGPRPPEVGKNISKAKKEKFAQKEAELGYKFDQEHRAKLAAANSGKTHTEEWKQENSKRMTQQWNDGTRKRAEPKTKTSMTPEEQAKLSSTRLTSLWADPDWAARQTERLKEGAKSRPPRTQESKEKARVAHLGKPKEANKSTYRIIFMDGTEVNHTGLKSLVDTYKIPTSTVGGAIRTKCSLLKYNVKSIERI